jgi:hypothetical protein
VNRSSVETRVIKFLIRQAEETHTPAAMTAVAVKSGLQVAHNEGALSLAERSKCPVIGAVQESAGTVEDAVDPFFHVTRKDILRVVPGAEVGMKVGTFVLRHAPIPSQVTSSVRNAVENFFEEIEGPKGGGGTGLDT